MWACDGLPSIFASLKSQQTLPVAVFRVSSTLPLFDAGPLTRDERMQMEQHPVIGERILARVEDYDEIARIVRHHHERVDGRGYPDGLHDDDIPLLSRIIAVADAYNAMTSQRPYRDAMPASLARLRLAQGVESQFDTSVVAAFEAILAAASEDYRVGRSTAFGAWAHAEGVA